MENNLTKTNADGRSATAPFMWWYVLVSFFLFGVICLNLPGSNKVLALCLMPATIFLGTRYLSILRNRMRLPLLFLILITVMGGISTFYAVSGKFALQGFLSLVIALCCALLLTILPDHASIRGWHMASVIAGSVSLISLFSLDLVSTRLLSTPLLSLLSRCNLAYAGIDGVEEYIRINSIYEAPNVFAGCAGIGVFLCLMLAHNSSSLRQKSIYLIQLYLNAMAFVLSFSMGAVASIAVAFVIYLVTEPKERRTSLFLLMLETFLFVLLGLPLASTNALAPWDGVQPIPLLIVALGASLLCITDNFICKRQKNSHKKAHKHEPLFWILPIVLVLGYVLIACLWTKGATLAPEGSLQRSVYLDPGQYTMFSSGTGAVTITVESQNRQEAMMHTGSVLYEGALSTAAFTVPEDSMVVSVTFSSQTQATLPQVTCVHSATQSSQTIPLDYPLLPDFVVTRMQGLFANENFLQRLVFFEDGLTLFQEYPLLGQGLGAFESSLFRIQSFYYETKYVHNHYIQTLLETGIVGLSLFLGLLIVSMRAILHTKKQCHPHPFTAGLAALLLFMAVHAAVEVIFSTGIYLPLAFGIFALTSICCGSTISLPQKIRNGGIAMAGGLFLSFTILLGCNLYAAHMGQHATSLEDYQQAAKWDPFEWTDYAVSYVANAPAFASYAVTTQAEEYIQRLDQETSNTIHYYLSQYFFQTGRMEKAMIMAEKQARHTISNSAWWNTLYAMIYSYDDGSKLYQQGIQNLSDLMNAWNHDHMGEILLEEDVQRFVDQVLRR